MCFIYFGFNSLQVSYKRKRRSEKHCHKDMVSIPYRLATNPNAISSIFARVKRFQFLIGQLQTDVEGLFVPADFVKFQFLIGQLQTPEADDKHIFIVSCFNSLQVSYKRKEWQGEIKFIICFNSLQVSYKQEELAEESLSFLEFQFLIGQLQTQRVARRDKVYNMFQFLIGQLQTQDTEELYQKYRHVSIPYRLATNWIFPLCFIRIFSFQFLIGQLQTLEFFHSDAIHVISFNSLQVSYKQGSQSLHIRLFLVSIPYRLATNRFRSSTAIRHKLVSIPYRLATNSLTKVKKLSLLSVSIPYRLATNL